MEVRPEPIRATRRILLQLLVACVLLALAAVAVGAALVQPLPHSAAPLAVGAGASASPDASPDASAKPKHDFPGRGNAFGRLFGGLGKVNQGGGNGRGPALGEISITAIDGAKVSLQSATGWQRTVDTTGIAMTRAGVDIKVGDLKIGDHVALDQTRNPDGTYTVKGLAVVLDEAGGTVSKVDVGSITVTRGKKTITIATDATTVYRRDGQTISRSDIKVGQQLTATGTRDADGSLAAEAVDVAPDVVMGTVTKIAGSTITVSTPGGGSATVVVTSKTSIRAGGKASATIADIAVKDVIVAQGVKSAGGTLTASSVRAGAWRAASPDGKWKGPKWRGGNASPSASPST